MSEEEPSYSAPPPTWQAHLCVLAAPEGYDATALYAELVNGSRPLFSVVDPEALARESKDPDVQAALNRSPGPVTAWPVAAGLSMRGLPQPRRARGRAARASDERAAA